MTRIVAFESVTLDGVMQAPGRADEDPRNGFEHGGWAAPYADPKMGEAATKSMGQTGGLLLGRRTYEDFHGFWPKRKDNPFTDVLNATPKYVASTTLREPLPWENSILLADDARHAVSDLRKQEGKDIVILGSGDLVRSLAARDLVDEYVLLIHPLVLGNGQRLFAGDAQMTRLSLVKSESTTTGVVIATYRRAQESEPQPSEED
jgi:dihydrofolate reductase